MPTCGYDQSNCQYNLDRHGVVVHLRRSMNAALRQPRQPSSSAVSGCWCDVGSFLADNVPVGLGPRALDVLLALIEAGGLLEWLVASENRNRLVRPDNDVSW